MNTQVKELTNISTIAKVVRSRISNQQYIESTETDLFQNTVSLAVIKFHELSLMLSHNPGLKEEYLVNPVRLFTKTKLNSLKKYSITMGEGLKIILDKNSVSVKLDYTSKCRCITCRDLISAYIFYSIAQGDFMSNMKHMTEAKLRKQSIIEVPNPFISKFLTEHLTTLLGNILIGSLFTFVELILQLAEKEPLEIKAAKKYKYKPIQAMIFGKLHTNCQEYAKSSNAKLSKYNISKVTYEKHCTLFKSVVGYEGDDVKDWQYFRYVSGTINTGIFEDCYAISPSLKLKRKLNMREFYNIKSFG
jgi:hypothetical protein